MTHEDALSRSNTESRSPATRAPSFSPAECLAWTILAAMIVLLHAWKTDPHLQNDSFQYLSTAANLALNGNFSTSILYFDEHRSTGQIPAPQTVFPIGYPAAIAALEILGLRPELSGIVVSALSAILLVPLFFWAGTLLDVPVFFLRSATMILIFNNAYERLATSILSESLFVLVSFLSLAIFLRAVSDPERRHARASQFLLGGLLLGLSCWVRYAGLFFTMGILLYFGVVWMSRRDRKWLVAFACAGTSVAFILATFARNFRLSGSIMGGNTKPVSRPWVRMAGEFLESHRYLLLGDASLKDVANLVILSILFAATATLCGTLLRSSNRRSRLLGLWTPAAAMIGCFTLSYELGLIYAARTSFISFSDPRLFYPILPPALLLIALVMSPGCRSDSPRSSLLTRSSTLVALACYCALHARGFDARRPSSEGVEDFRKMVEEPLGESPSLTRWLDAHTRPGRPIIAGDGQVFGYLTHRDTVSLVPAHYSQSEWTETRLREMASTYGSEVIVLFPDGVESRTIALESSFLGGLLRRDPSPSWISLEASNRQVLVYRVRPQPAL